MTPDQVMKALQILLQILQNPALLDLLKWLINHETNNPGSLAKAASAFLPMFKTSE